MSMSLRNKGRRSTKNNSKFSKKVTMESQTVSNLESGPTAPKGPTASMVPTQPPQSPQPKAAMVLMQRKDSTQAMESPQPAQSSKPAESTQPTQSTEFTGPQPSTSHGTSSQPSNEACGICEVWGHNLDDEFHVLRKLITTHYYIAMDTEFPGVVATPIGDFKSPSDFQYQMLRINVDLLKLIQLGLTFMDANGNLAPGPYTTWQFNFKFDLDRDIYAQDSIDLLKNSGIQFDKHKTDGIDPLEFAEMLMSSGIILMDEVVWMSFHSSYDFGYLIKLLTVTNLPHDESVFYELLKLYFPIIYDLKYLLRAGRTPLRGGLQDIAYQLNISRKGLQHQAGSDSLVTGMVFFKVKKFFFNGEISEARYNRRLFGLGNPILLHGKILIYDSEM